MRRTRTSLFVLLLGLVALLPAGANSAVLYEVSAVAAHADGGTTTIAGDELLVRMQSTPLVFAKAPRFGEPGSDAGSVIDVVEVLAPSVDWLQAGDQSGGKQLVLSYSVAMPMIANPPTQQVPEPSSLVLLAMSITALGWVSRRHKQAP